MATYTVQHNDTPASIAKKLTGNAANMNALVIANPDKKWVSRSGQLTFSDLSVGEKLNIPIQWRLPTGSQYTSIGSVGSTGAATPANPYGSTGAAGPNSSYGSTEATGSSGFNLGFNNSFGVGEPHPSEGTKSIGFVGIGDPASDGTATALSALASSSSLCQSGNPTVIAFQNSYNGTTPAPSTPLAVDGDYGPATQAALQSVVGTGPIPQACTSYTAGSTTYTAAQLVTLANAVIADTSICSGTNQNVSAFQTAYNQVYNASLSIDGLYGAQTNAAMTSVANSATLSGAVPAACSNFATAAGSAASGSAITVPATTITASGGAGGAGGSFSFGP